MNSEEYKMEDYTDLPPVKVLDDTKTENLVPHIKWEPEEDQIDVENCLLVKVEPDDANTSYWDCDDYFGSGGVSEETSNSFLSIDDDEIGDEEDKNSSDIFIKEENFQEYNEKEIPIETIEIDDDDEDSLRLSDDSENNQQDGLDPLFIGNARLECKTCKKVFTREKSFVKHVNLCVSQFCNICSVPLYGASSLKYHMSRHHSFSDIKCEICQMKFPNITQLNTHILTHKSARKCNHCSKIFSCKKGLTTHMLVHKKHLSKHQMCNTEFSKQDALKEHLKSHVISKSHKCAVCGKMFSLKSDFKDHLKSHSVERPHKCNVCNKSFVTEGNLKLHLQIHEYQQSARSFNCKVCDEVFTRFCDYSKHVFMHKEYEYQCTVCKKPFFGKDDFDKHVLVHTQKNIYRCDVCGKWFRTEQQLQKHISSH